MLQSDHCIVGKEGKFRYALWMSSRTASTLGFNAIQPNPECTFTNLMVMCQVRGRPRRVFCGPGLEPAEWRERPGRL